MNFDHLRESTQMGYSILLSTRDDVTEAIRSSFDEVIERPWKKPIALVVLGEDSSLLMEVVKKGALCNYPDFALFYEPSAEVLELLKKKDYVGGMVELEGQKVYYCRSKRRRTIPLTWDEENETIKSLAGEGEYQEALDLVDSMQVEERNRVILDFHRSRVLFYLKKDEEGLKATNIASLSVYNDTKHRIAALSNFPHYVKKTLRASRIISFPRSKRMSYTAEKFVAVCDKGILSECTWEGTRFVESEGITHLGSNDYRVFEGEVYTPNFTLRDGTLQQREIKGCLFRREGEIDSVLTWQPLKLHSGKQYERDNENWSDFISCTPGIPYKEGTLFIILCISEKKRYHRFVYITEFSRSCSIPIFLDAMAQVEIVSISKIEEEFVISYRNLLTGASCVAWYDAKRIEKIF
jgi:hypothetical protein